MCLYRALHNHHCHNLYSYVPHTTFSLHDLQDLKLATNVRKAENIQVASESIGEIGHSVRENKPDQSSSYIFRLWSDVSGCVQSLQSSSQVDLL
jgi:hypothetical protein